METPTDINDEIDRQTFAEMTRFKTSPDIKNILVTGGNGFLYVFGYIDIWIVHPVLCFTWLFLISMKRELI